MPLGCPVSKLLERLEGQGARLEGRVGLFHLLVSWKPGFELPERYGPGTG
jgi:hypothetical protein